MPVHKTQDSGWQYGPGGKVYKGKGAKAKAERQGRAIAISKARAAGHNIARKGKK